MTAPAGAIVSIYFDGRRLEVGNRLRTPRGRTYQVMDVRVQQRGKHRGRQHLRCLVVDDVTDPPGVVVVPLVWYARSRKPREGGPT